jgi:hypothetical protein
MVLVDVSISLCIWHERSVEVNTINRCKNLILLYSYGVIMLVVIINSKLSPLKNPNLALTHVYYQLHRSSVVGRSTEKSTYHAISST